MRKDKMPPKKESLKWTCTPNIKDSTGFELQRFITWMQNAQVNRQVAATSLHLLLLPKIHGSALIIDKSPDCTNFDRHIESIKDYKGTIICCDRALYSIIKHRLPNYVCNIDSSHLCLNFYDRPDVRKVMHKITALFSVTSNPLLVRLWQGRRTFFCPPYPKNISEMYQSISLSPSMETGGNVATLSYVLAYNLGANPIAYFGVTNGYRKLRQTEYLGNVKPNHRKQKGPYGEYWTNNVEEYYAQAGLAYAEYLYKTEKIKTINTTQAGLLYGKHIENMSLEQFVKQFQ
jgi:hypothetical protein